MLRYLPREQVGRYRTGSRERHFVTPTPYSAQEAVSWLALPLPLVKRGFVMLLNPSAIEQVQGPRRIAGGGGIEYILPSGFGQQALVFSFELQIG